MVQSSHNNDAQLRLYQIPTSTLLVSLFLWCAFSINKSIAFDVDNEMKGLTRNLYLNRHTKIPEEQDANNPLLKPFYTMPPTVAPPCVVDEYTETFSSTSSTELVYGTPMVVDYTYEMALEYNGDITVQEAIDVIETNLGNAILAEFWDECPSLNASSEQQIRKRKLQVDNLVYDFTAFSSSPKDTANGTGCEGITAENSDAICTRVDGHFTLFTGSTPNDETTMENAVIDVIQDLMEDENSSLFTDDITNITYVDTRTPPVFQSLEEPIQMNTSKDDKVWVVAPVMAFCFVGVAVYMKLRKKLGRDNHSVITNNDDNSMYGKYDMEDLNQTKEMDDSMQECVDGDTLSIGSNSRMSLNTLPWFQTKQNFDEEGNVEAQSTQY